METTRGTSDYPALSNGVVTQAHTNDCLNFGHAVHLTDGVDNGVCPRCGEVTEKVSFVHAPRKQVFCEAHFGEYVEHPLSAECVGAYMIVHKDVPRNSNTAPVPYVSETDKWF